MSVILRKERTLAGIYVRLYERRDAPSPMGDPRKEEGVEHRVTLTIEDDGDDDSAV